MSNPILPGINFSKETAVVQGIHWIARGVYLTRNYRWELRRNGEIKMGYWKKVLRKRSARSVYPKRFVLIPGFGDSPLSWSLVMMLLNPILKLHYDEIILLDFPGFGGFLNQERTFPSMDLMINAVSDILDSLKPHTIVGHSLGAWLTTFYAGYCGNGTRPIANKLNYSGPNTIILANPSGIFLDSFIKDKWEGIFRNAMNQGFSLLRPHLFLKEPPWFQLIAPYFSNFLNREDIKQFMNTFREEHDASQIAAHISSKVWLIWGDSDSLIPPSCTQAWFRHLNPNFKSEQTAVWLRAVGHSPHLEKPAVTAAVIGQILTGKAPHAFGKRWWEIIKNN